MANDRELTPGQRAARRRKAGIVGGLFMLLFGMPPLINAIDNPRLAALRVPDVLGLFASGLCFGFGIAFLIVGLATRGE